MNDAGKFDEAHVATVVQRLMRDCTYRGKHVDSDPLVCRDGATIYLRVTRDFEEDKPHVVYLRHHGLSEVMAVHESSVLAVYIYTTTNLDYDDEEIDGEDIIEWGFIESAENVTSSHSTIRRITDRLNAIQRVRWCDCGNFTTRPKMVQAGSVLRAQYCDRCTAQGIGDGPSSAGADLECLICMKALRTAHAAPLNCCSASYHVGCLKQWNEKCTDHKRGTCPQCSTTYAMEKIGLHASMTRH